MEIFRFLGAMVEAPGPASIRGASIFDSVVPPTAAEYTDLFGFQLYPYASVYLGAEGMMGGEARARIGGFWRALGETPPPEPDHLTVLLSAYAQLAERQAEADTNEARSRWRHVRSAFLWEHLLSWLSPYLEKVGELGSDFYRGWSEALGTALLEEARALPYPGILPLHLREAPAMGDLDDAGGDEFLQAVTTPVRTGMIVTRSDLGRCAGALGLGLRMGERRFALKTLLGQAPRETLEWLAVEADRWAQMHGNRNAALMSISAFWQGRAEAASSFLSESAASLSPS